MKKAWKDVEVDETIETKSGSTWVVVTNEKGKAKGTRKVTLRGASGTYPKVVESSVKVKIVEAPVVRQVRRGGMEPIDAPRRSPFAGIIGEKPERSANPWQVDPLDTATAKVEGRKNATAGGGGSWNGAKGKAEKALRGIGAELVGIQPTGGAPYSTPPVDPTTIKGHLFLMHEVEAESLTVDELYLIHDRDHAKADADANYSLPVPHHHAAERPAID